MSCERIADRLDDLLEGRLSDVEHRAAEEHLRQCADCRDLVATMRGTLEMLGAGEVAVPGGEAAAGLANDILARTTGPTCGRAQSFLCDLVDGVLEREDAQLVEAHLEHCARCGALRATLAWLRSELPQMSVLEPRPELVPEILRATTGAGRKRSPALAAVFARARNAWEHLAGRPRLAWELAYVATVLVVLLCGTSLSPFRRVPERALAAIQIEPRSVAQSTLVQLQQFHHGVGVMGGRAWDATGGRVAASASAQAAAYAARHPGMPEAWSALERHSGELREELAARNLAGASLVMRSVGEDLQLLWQSQQAPAAGAADSSGQSR